MKQKAKEIYLKNEQLARYFVMAAVIVGIEYSSYLFMFWVGIQYLLAVPISMAIGIILNWHFSRVFVFKNRRHPPKKEFTLVLTVSLIGVGIQIAVTYLVVRAVGLPEIGKLLAIIVTFFWNFYARKRFIF